MVRILCHSVTDRHFIYLLEWIFHQIFHYLWHQQLSWDIIAQIFFWGRRDASSSIDHICLSFFSTKSKMSSISSNSCLGKHQECCLFVYITQKCVSCACLCTSQKLQDFWQSFVRGYGRNVSITNKVYSIHVPACLVLKHICILWM